MAAEFETVDVWIGVYLSAERLEAYLQEHIDPDDDDAPISEFAQAMDETFYDHDFVEHNFYGSTVPIARLLENHSYARSYVDSVLKAASEAGISSGNATVLVWNCEITNPDSDVTNEYALHYIGRFDCDPSMGT
jgi:hypothetical protein